MKKPIGSSLGFCELKRLWEKLDLRSRTLWPDEDGRLNHGEELVPHSPWGAPFQGEPALPGFNFDF